jgi:hypothetical protein
MRAKRGWWSSLYTFFDPMTGDFAEAYKQVQSSNVCEDKGRGFIDGLGAF